MLALAGTVDATSSLYSARSFATRETGRGVARLHRRIPGHPAYEYARSHYVTLGHVRRGLRNCDFHSSSLLDPCITHGTRYTCLTQV